MHSLVVEDTAILAGLLAEILIHLGHRVRAAADLDGATGAIERRRPAVVLVDRFLLDSSSRAARARFLRLVSCVPVVFLVDGGAGAGAVDLPDRLAATAVVRKPFDLRELSDAVAAVLQDGPAARDASGPRAGETVAG
jgi:DNA-binding response OmpR family regulator